MRPSKLRNIGSNLCPADLEVVSSNRTAELREFLACAPIKTPPIWRLIAERRRSSYLEQLIEYDDLEGGVISAFLLVPSLCSDVSRVDVSSGGSSTASLSAPAIEVDSEQATACGEPGELSLPSSAQAGFPAVIVHHQHNGERHLGKSEVCGLAGDALQAFGPLLAEAGLVVLAPDSICFEDRRINQTGTALGAGDSDWMQHFFEMEYRLVRGDTMMRKVLHDASLGVSLLSALPFVDSGNIGALGHSYGGNTVLFEMAVDERIAFGCASGSACTYKTKFANRIGLEMALVIPGFCRRFDIPDVVRAIAPRRLLLVSASRDPYSLDADEIYDECVDAFVGDGLEQRLQQKRCDGEHNLDQERFDHIVDWMKSST